MSNIQHQIDTIMAGRHVHSAPTNKGDACLVVRSEVNSALGAALAPNEVRMVLTGAAQASFKRLKQAIRMQRQIMADYIAEISAKEPQSRYARALCFPVNRRDPHSVAYLFNDKLIDGERLPTSAALEALHVARRIEKEREV